MRCAMFCASISTSDFGSMNAAFCRSAVKDLFLHGGYRSCA